ncbi:hypothetical protein F5Y15DRAFT_333367 [Xylariaceae sp. FL0016]|nr:hypothetical protein F5Y15DRAFT_333367 [Xylariaceae sp. FL0016]
MTAPKPTEEGNSSGPQTPKRVIAVKTTTPNAAPALDSDQKAETPDGVASKSAPVAARRRAATTKQPPTLLNDFLLGRQSPARIAAEKAAAKEAQKKRKEELEEIKQEMRRAAVQQVQAPGGVRDRVNKWQKANAQAMANADPFAAPSEPSEIHIQVDDESVTEQDRVRIKMRQRKRSVPDVVVVEQDKTGGDAEKEDETDPKASAPKKRVVSDTNWVRNQRKSPPRKRSPKAAQNRSTGSPLPKDFLNRPTANPPVSKKIKDWAAKVEIPDEPPKHHSASRSVGSGDGIRVRSVPSDSDATSRRSGSTHIIVETTGSNTTRSASDDGIRVKPSRTRAYPDDGIRVIPQKSTLLDDGIRIRPGPRASDDASTVRAASRPTSRTSSSRVTATEREPPSSDRIEVLEDSESDEPATPTRASAATRLSSKKPSKARQKKATSYADTGTTVTEDVSDSESWTSGSEVESDIPSSAPQNSLADIPFGYSAFSELDLPLGPDGRPTGRPRPKANRQSSFKGATHVLKKAFTEGKKILTEKAEPPKPAQNCPPNIENWLQDTVDPFVEAEEEAKSEPQRKSVKEEWADDTRTQTQRSASSSRPKSSDIELHGVEKHGNREEPTSVKEPKADNLQHEEPTTPSSSGLKRSRATRVNSSPLKLGGKKGFKEKLRDAFRGESSGHNPPPLEYSSYEERTEYDDDYYDDEYSDQWRSSATRTNLPHDDDNSSISAEPVNPSPPRRRPPPTSGVHELSTIISDAETLSTFESDLSSLVSETTVTQSTGLTRSSAVSRKRSNKSSLKRRLTKHSDLVSVLSLPDEPAEPRRSRSLRSARSVRRTSNHPKEATVEGLLREFANDENLYSRELKTLVDGVIPVLLSQLVQGPGGSTKDLFEPSSSSSKEDMMSKAVVNMGVALEKLKNQHRRCPLSDVHRLPQWLDTVHAVYDNYSDVWRLGFQGIVVNLASTMPDDADSLINAMPRNKEGDVLNEDGDRIDVAHLLKRPLVRVKWITKFINGYQTATGSQRHDALASKWEALQEKTRRRYKEESARIIDDDAKNTDTSRVRDLKTMESLEHVRIDRFRQVYAKDAFSLDLRHSNGQRLDCQVELVFRDNQLFKSDPGDLLIRETGSGGRSWLLFAPVTGSHLSARKGDHRNQLVVMIRGYKDEWFELVTLTTDNEDQVEDWLDILGTSPVPPEVKLGPSSETLSSVLSPKSAAGEIPLGERKLRCEPIRPTTPTTSSDSPQHKYKTPTRYHQRNASVPTTPTSAAWSSPSSEKTTTQQSYHSSHLPRSHEISDEGRSRSLSEAMRPDPASLKKPSPNSSPYRQDGAPPPPVHRNFGSKSPKSPKSSTLSPPADNHSNLKRRTSSPLKHEYYPSDISSESSYSGSETETEGFLSDESSDDELEMADMPDTAPAISIKRDVDVPAESVISETTVSLTPSASASQAGVPTTIGKQPEYLFKSMAAISYWDNKYGCWKDLWPDVCSIVTTPGLIEAYPLRRTCTSSDTPKQEEDRPLIALDLTPLVMLRNSTALDLEIRSPVLRYARLFSKVNKVESSFFRFRAPSIQECESLYMAVHRARLDNVKYKALEEEARIRSFGQNQTTEQEGDGSSHRRSWFGRKSSYRASTRAPSQSAGGTSHSSVSASSFLKRLMGGNASQFNIAMSSVDRPRPGSREASLYTSSSGSGTPPRSPSVSAANSGNTPKMGLTTNNLKIRLHLLVTSSKWEDHGNCYLEVTRPDQGTRQNLRKYQGMEKRIVVVSVPKKGKDGEQTTKLDVVLGSRCFTRLGSRGILLNVWEEVKDESGAVGAAPKGGNSGGNVNKWCFQCASVMEANWIFGLVTQEVVIG